MKYKKVSSGLHYILRADERVKISVSREVRDAIWVWAESNNVTVAEATWHLLRCGFRYDMGRRDPNTKMYQLVRQLLGKEWNARLLKRTKDDLDRIISVINEKEETLPDD